MKTSGSLLCVGLCFLFFFAVRADADDTDLFSTQVEPDVLLVLDLSKSMDWAPAGERMYIGSSQSCNSDVAYYAASGSGHTKACSIDPYDDPVPFYSNESCSGPFYINKKHSGFTTECSRLAIAKRAIFALLDDNRDGTVDDKDDGALRIRMAYMRFYDCDQDDTGGNYSSGCNKLVREIGAKYSQVWSSVSNDKASGGTPVASALKEAKLYLDAHKNLDPAKDCRKKFVILVTDGADTFACSGDGQEDQTGQYKRRRETIARAKALADAGYSVFVVGFGVDMSHYLENSLNWAAYYGKTDNLSVANSGDTGGYAIPASQLYPTGLSACEASSYTSHNAGEGTHYYATSSDPGEKSLAGYAFVAKEASELTSALKSISKYIQETAFSFTSPSVSAVQTTSADTVYLSSFIPRGASPIWDGTLAAYRLDQNGILPLDGEGKPLASSLIWTQSFPANRVIKTYRRGAFVDFSSANMTKEDLGVATDAARDTLIATVNGLGLGDIFHSNPVIVGEPSRYFEDQGFSGSGGFYQANKNRTKVILVGANDGTLHAFDGATGVEKWAFIPNSLLKSLQTLTTTHAYYVDSSPKVADVWFDTNGDNKKSSGEWKTVLVCGLRKGGKSYFALDITDTVNPKYLWEFPNPSDPNYASILAKLGQSWSEPNIGRVKVGGSEKWVAFIGGGFDDHAVLGKTFYVVDLKTGFALREFSGIAGMNKSLAAPPTAVDTNGDGYVDKVYSGDLGGTMWVFDVSDSDAAKWTAKGFFSSSHPIYYQPAVTSDKYGNTWVYFGTGDRENPNDTTSTDAFYGVKDDEKGSDGKGAYPLLETHLSNITGQNTFNPVSGPGWYMKLARAEKVLARPSVFSRLVYFTTYTYIETNTCSSSCTGKLYVVEYLSGGGALAVDDLSDLQGTAGNRSKDIPAGLPSAPVISVALNGKASVTVQSTGASTGARASSGEAFMTPIKTILYWREVTP